eukprot:1966249-Amphidinium_carterae.1
MMKTLKFDVCLLSPSHAHRQHRMLFNVLINLLLARRCTEVRCRARCASKNHWELHNRLVD